MTFVDIVVAQGKGMFPSLFYFFVLGLIPFIVAEQLRPVGQAPRVGDYGMNILIAFTTTYLALPLGVAAGMWSGQLRPLLPWKPISLTFGDLGALPLVGPALEVLAMIFVPLVLHDIWLYSSHRLEHRVPVLWEFHKLHHSDERMNSSTWARDHFLQSGWRAFFPVFTLGLIFDLELAEAGRAAFYSTLFLIGLSMFYHSAIRVQLPWLDRVLVTPQVHRIHHSTDPAHYNRNFADALPIFDILFGTYYRPARDEFPATGLGPAFPAPRSIWSAQFGPLLAVGRMLSAMMRGPAESGESRKGRGDEKA